MEEYQPEEALDQLLLRSKLVEFAVQDCVTQDAGRSEDGVASSKLVVIDLGVAVELASECSFVEVSLEDDAKLLSKMVSKAPWHEVNEELVALVPVDEVVLAVHSSWVVKNVALECIPMDAVEPGEHDGELSCQTLGRNVDLDVGFFVSENGTGVALSRVECWVRAELVKEVVAEDLEPVSNHWESVFLEFCLEHLEVEVLELLEFVHVPAKDGLWLVAGEGEVDLDAYLFLESAKLLGEVCFDDWELVVDFW